MAWMLVEVLATSKVTSGQGPICCRVMVNNPGGFIVLTPLDDQTAFNFQVRKVFTHTDRKAWI